MGKQKNDNSGKETSEKRQLWEERNRKQDNYEQEKSEKGQFWKGTV